MEIKELLQKRSDGALAVAKALKDGETDNAVDLLTKQAEEVTELIAKAEEEENQDPEPTTDPEPTGDGDGGDEGGDEPAGDAGDGTEPVEKTTVELTKTQQDALAVVESIGVEKLQKRAELWVSGSDLGDLVNQLAEANGRIEALEKASKQDTTEVQKTNGSSLSGLLNVG